MTEHKEAVSRKIWATANELRDIFPTFSKQPTAVVHGRLAHLIKPKKGEPKLRRRVGDRGMWEFYVPDVRAHIKQMFNGVK